jgi:oxygen-independent coproporphyrinogen-3 oxidase
MDYSFGQLPSERHIQEYLRAPYGIGSRITEGFRFSEEERIRKRLALNLFDIDVASLDAYNFDHCRPALVGLLEALVAEGLLLKLGGSRYQLTSDGLKYRDIASWLFFSEKVSGLDAEFYAKMREKCGAVAEASPVPSY